MLQGRCPFASQKLAAGCGALPNTFCCKFEYDTLKPKGTLTDGNIQADLTQRLAVSIICCSSAPSPLLCM